ncbi:MAG: alpha/beta hydrolase [Fibrobacter sp.]|nr:alpha/beta hydrolase [Fibrobacter sp.]
MNVSGRGPHKVVVETNSDPGIKEGTIYRPEDLGPGKNYPIFVWGNGACSLDGKSNAAALAEIASHGYFVISDGTPGGGGGRPMDLGQIIKPARAYVTWAIAENRKPCSAYYQSLDTTKVAGNGFSCGGYFGQALAGDPRTTTWGVSSSGSFGDNPDLWNSVHTPVLILEGNRDVRSQGGTDAYFNGLRDYDGIAARKWPVYFISHKNMGHGGDLGSSYGGEFTKINLAWLNWWLKGDTGTTGKGVLVGSTCTYCTDNNWEIKSANIP